LTQCFSNLLDNAVNFVAPGTIPYIRVRAEEKESRVRLWVEDNGIGLPRDAHARLFEIFQRFHSEDAFPGTGMGLAIVRKAVQRLGGEVGVESELGRGSRFWVELAKG
jgi:signal transduction histidine kinase